MDEPAVLCIDDNEFIGDAIFRIVRARPGWRWLGWSPTIAGAMERLGGVEAAVVILDLDLAGEDSLAFVARLAAERPGVRVLMLSGHLTAGLVELAIAAGAWGYLSKNDDSERLIEAIEGVASGRIALSSGARELLRQA